MLHVITTQSMVFILKRLKICNQKHKLHKGNKKYSNIKIYWSFHDWIVL